MTVNVTMPKAWKDLSQDELGMVYDVMELHEDEDVRFFLLRRFIGLERVRSSKPKDGFYRYVVKAESPEGIKSFTLYLSALMFAGWIDTLDWVYSPGTYPVRLDTLGGAKAVNAMFHGVSFRTYYMVENYYQGYISSRNPSAIARLEKLLYPGAELDTAPGVARTLNIINWIAQIKTVFSSKFRNFFRPARVGSEDNGMPDMLDIMNNEIRILTGGDVTKEEAINNTDCWRALTELDFKAREAEEFKRQQRNYNK